MASSGLVIDPFFPFSSAFFIRGTDYVCELLGKQSFSLQNVYWSVAKDVRFSFKFAVHTVVILGQLLQIPMPQFPPEKNEVACIK